MRVRSSVRLEHRTFNPFNTNNYSFTDINWLSFQEWLQRKGFSNQYSRDIFLYAQKYSSCLLDGNLSTIEGIKAERKTMASLANLSKFLGMYQDWRTLRLQYNLKWKQSVSSESVFLNLYNGKYEMNEMLRWILEAKQKLPYEYFFPLAYDALTGLREVEMSNSLNKISSQGLLSYPFNEEMGVIEHFREPAKFFRHNKKVYISALTPKLVEHLKDWHIETSHSKLKCKLYRVGIKDQMKGLRKWYGTTLRMAGLPSEFVDLMQGRVSQDVFVKSYFRYDLKDLIGKARTVLSEYEKIWLE
jgi:intergrase/recombinase